MLLKSSFFRGFTAHQATGSALLPSRSRCFQHLGRVDRLMPSVDRLDFVQGIHYLQLYLRIQRPILELLHVVALFFLLPTRGDQEVQLQAFAVILEAMPHSLHPFRHCHHRAEFCRALISKGMSASVLEMVGEAKPQTSPVQLHNEQTRGVVSRLWHLAGAPLGLRHSPATIAVC